MGVPYDFGATPPTGFLKCDGSIISRTSYADLFGVLSTTYGVGDGSLTFAIPDFRGEFLRGSGGDAAAIGTSQTTQNKGESSNVFAHGHTGGASVLGATNYGVGSGRLPLQMKDNGYPDNYGGFTKPIGLVAWNLSLDNSTDSHSGAYGRGYNDTKVYIGHGGQDGSTTMAANTESRPPNYSLHWVIKF